MKKYTKEQRLDPANNWKTPIYESRDSYKVVDFANQGYGMSDRWWNETYRVSQERWTWAVYKTKSGLRRMSF